MPSPLEKLKKFLMLESDRGYDNRAVVGGLDKILPSWKAEADALGVPAETIDLVDRIISGYPQLDVRGRAEAVQSLNTHIAAVNPNLLRDPLPVSETLPAETPVRKPDHAVESSAQPGGIYQPGHVRAATQNQAGLIGLTANLTVLNGIGPKTAQTLEQLGLVTLEDLLYYFPRRYDDYSQLKPINRLKYGDEVSVLANVKSAFTRPIKGGKLTMTEAVVEDGTGALRITWFNQPWLEKSIRPDTQLVLSGKIDMYLGRLCMNSPDWEPIEQEHLHTNRIVPVYPLTAKVTQKSLRRMMHQTITFWSPRIPDFLPKQVIDQGNLITLNQALMQIHFPDSHELLHSAQERLAFDEIFLLQLGVIRQKRAWQANVAQSFTVTDEWLQQQIDALPYPLTGAQQRAIQDIRGDLASGNPMNRLLQGDVGSGKTVVAALAMAFVNSNGAQAAIMAPTSILAEQHYRSLSALMAGNDSNGSLNLYQPGEIRLLLGDTPEAEKQEIRAGLADGSIKLVVGTHALIEGPIEFRRLQIAVVDEQHRFGVAQRSALRAKGENPHLLVMTATPIPRSLALTVYGDLDVTVMDEMPVGRLPIETHILAPVERERAYTLIRSQVEQDHQAFIIYPLVEQGEKEDALAAVEERDRLQIEVFPQLKLGLLHGRLKPEEKDQVMTAFRNREYHILVSTSVVEVGVDVPNATVMMVEGANRFGLAQLHQFRGRVGRGADQSFCLLIPDSDDAVENERLQVMTETNDGFVLAERDLEQRGPGDFLGTRQAGFAELRLANLSNIRLIEKARNLAHQLIDRDPDLKLTEHTALTSTLNRFWGNGRGDIS
ncbi:MAG TPA: ATP-dependent DNA helicase RecG [Bellilinea sp.]|nr:ATP-dependent DNA helicase RecG [Bellilinea sp.]